MTTYPFIPIFWSGKHKNKGSKKDWTVEDVKNIFDATQQFDEEKIPFTIDHPTNDLPVIGWTNKTNLRLVFDSDKAIIEAKPTVFSESNLKAIKESGRKKVSIALRPDDYSIRHIGLVENPAVTDLPAIPFSQDEYIQFEMETEDALFMGPETAWNFNMVGQALQGYRDYLIEKESLDVADKIMPQYLIDNLKSARSDEEYQQFMNYKPITKEGAMPDPVTPDTSKSDSTEALQFKAELEAKEAELAKQAERIAALEAEKRDMEFNQFLDSQDIKEKVMPANRDRVLRLMKALDGQSEYEFSEGNSTVKKSPIEDFQDMLTSLPKQIQFGEFATGGIDTGDENVVDAVIDQLNKERR